MILPYFIFFTIPDPSISAFDPSILKSDPKVYVLEIIKKCCQLN